MNDPHIICLLRKNFPLFFEWPSYIPCPISVKKKKKKKKKFPLFIEWPSYHMSPQKKFPLIFWMTLIHTMSHLSKKKKKKKKEIPLIYWNSPYLLNDPHIICLLRKNFPLFFEWPSYIPCPISVKKKKKKKKITLSFKRIRIIMT